MVRFFGGNTLVVEEDLRPVGPRGCHGIGKVGDRLLGVGSAIGRVERIEVVRTVDGGVLNLGRIVVPVHHVAFIVDRREIACGGEDLLGGAGGDDHPVGDRVIVGGVGGRGGGQQRYRGRGGECGDAEAAHPTAPR